MIITGDPGAGKTILALELVLGLLQDRKSGDKVPLRLALSSWSELRSRDSTTQHDNDPSQVLREWVCRNLGNDYGLSAIAAKVLFDAGKVLPILDGLDEMDTDDRPGWSSEARKAIEAVNSYQHGLRKADLVLTCRSDQYYALKQESVRMKDAAEIEIQRVIPTKARTFVERRAEDPTRWREVLDAIDRDTSGSLSQSLATPWRLTLAVMVYEQRDRQSGEFLRSPVELLSLSSDEPSAIRDHLLSHFIEASISVNSFPRGGSYEVAQVHTWLHTLAGHLFRLHTVGVGSIGNVMLGFPENNIVMDRLWVIPTLQSRTAFYVLGNILAIPWVGVSAGIAISAATPEGAPFFYSLATMWVMFLLMLYAFRSNAYHIGMDRPWIRNSLSDVGLGASGGLLSSMIFGYGFGLIVGAVFWLVFGAAFSAGVGLNTHGPGVFNHRRRYSRVVYPFFTFGGVGFCFVGNLHLTLFSWVLSALGMFFWISCTVGNTLAMHGMRYLGMLLCARRGEVLLPWRLGRFLRWAEKSGLIRVAGGAYQFRHEELQRWILVTPPSRP
ncbi:NACHT domain-containing protein [Streptomyces sp. NPDC053560]|uniref:NACHT domain-containing protein n=1 Tax=Streptomyces sp. NPDC053560 TaxID=3365711 RepID=UPI0037D58983